MTGWVMSTTFFLLSLSMVLAFYRLLIGPTLPDRVVALELIALIIVAFIIAYSMHTNVPNFLDVAMVLALTGFMGAIGFARFLERGGSRDE